MAKPQQPLLFKSSASVAGSLDTLEVFCLYVNFFPESDKDDQATTTGLGNFGTAGVGINDVEKKNLAGYTLDPDGAPRRYKFYLEKHFEFAKNYFEKVSNGRVTVSTRIFPEPDAKGQVTPYQLKKTMKAYNPSELDKDSKQKISDFNDERGQRLMSFVVDAIQAADKSTDLATNPFKKAFAEAKTDSLNTKKHRCYLLFHAGHSRLLDGGQLGAFGANTPNDFTDFFVTKDDFSLLDSATTNAKKGGPVDADKRATAKGVKVSTGDTVDNIMMLSEAASQDKVNWGINGILINQLARQMGMPDMFDVVKGISQLGFFDVMDFAGYNTLNGFLPVYPSAWVRAYMGWDEPVVAKAGTGPFSEYQLWSPTAAPGAGRATTVKVPINDREYFLVENRQRAAGDSTVTIYYSEKAADGDLTFGKQSSKTIRFSQIDSLFLDSVPDPADAKHKKLIVNPLKPAGVITGASSYDLGLPGSGMLVWHVNEWFISQFLKDGAVNAYLGDTLKCQYKGLELVEADGSLSIGKEFKDQLGQPAFDYGSGSDMLPHLRVKRVNPPKDTTWSTTKETLDMIGPYGAANTNAWNDGRTHIRLEAPVPDKPLLEPGISSFSGDSIYNVRDSVLTLRVRWPDNKTLVQDPKWAWPVKLDPGGLPQSVNVLKSSAGTRYVVALSDRGYAQAFTNEGTTALDPDTTLKGKPGYDSVKTLLPSGLTRDTSTIPVTSLAGRLGRPLGSAVCGDSALAVLTADHLTFLKLRAAGLATRSKDSSAASVRVDQSGQAGPVAAGDRFWILAGKNTGKHRAVAYTPDGTALDSIDLPDLEYQGLAAYPAGGGKPMNLAAAAKGGGVVLIDVDAHRASRLQKPWGDEEPDADESFSVSAADFDRDGAVDLFVLGSKGAATLVGIKGAPQAAIFAGYPQRFPRSVHFLDTLYETKNGTRKITRVLDFNSDDASAPALADLDGDNRPDIVFSATNSVFAVDSRGAILKGWPFQLEAHQNVGFAYGSALHPETALRTSPIVLSLDGHATVLIGSPDGLILAVDSLGRKLRSSSYESVVDGRGGLLSTDVGDWPLTMGGLTLDSNDNPYIHLSAADLDGDGNLELLAQSGSGSLNAWTLKKGAVKPGQSWTMPGGDAARSNFLDVSAWSAASAPGTAETIEEFHLFPSPVRGPTASVHLRLGSAASKARIRVYDIAGAVVRDQQWKNLTEGTQPFNQVLDLKTLGPDVYSAQVEVWFPGGKQKKWVRFGVIR